MKELEYENTHCHTYYSNTQTLLDSTVSIEDYAEEYVKRKMQCLVMSEHGFRGDIFNQAIISEEINKKYSYNMKPICAAEAYFVPDRKNMTDARNFHLLLLAKDNAGFKQLNKVLSEGQISGFYHNGRLDFDLLSQIDYKHFLCTTACVGGILKDPQGEAYANMLHEIFKENFRLEVQYHNNDAQKAHNEKVISLYKKYGWPLILGTDSHYIKKQDKILRKELQLSANIDMSDSGWDLYLPTAKEVVNSLMNQGVLSKSQIEEAMENTLEVREFEGFSYDRERKLPISKLRQNMTRDERNQLYVDMVWNGYKEKAGEPTPEEAKEIQQEIDTIIGTNSADYFISLKDMLDRGVELGGVLTTTARGSAGSYVSNYALGFTSINRLRAPVTMYPERFISADKLRAGSPDIDSNLTNAQCFVDAGKEMFGEWGCVPMIAYSKTKTSAAFKLLARARNIDFDVSNEVSKQIKSYELDKKHAIENNSDDPDYNVDDEIRIEDYVDQKYLQLIKDSEQYQGIIVGITPHPCGHITYHKDLREEIGIVRVKSKTGNKEPKFCAYIDGVTADYLNYIKSDILRVDVVKLISKTFETVNRKTMPVNELLDIIKTDKEVWDLYSKGITLGLNQCEKPASTQKCMQFKPQNIVELSSFIASIRPGFKSMGPTFWSRTKFKYGINSLDELLKIPGMIGNSGDSSFLIFDEQILKILIAGGIDAAEAYATIKHIKKKHRDKVLEEKEKFKNGFTKYLIEKEGSSEKNAHEVVEKIWKIIEDSSSYLFCCAHSFAMACDSAYCAYLKAHYPYEFYTTMLRLYTEKGNQEKIALIIDEMRRYKNIHLKAGLFGLDNRDWAIDKSNNVIYQDIASVKFIGSNVAEDLYSIKDNKFDTFIDMLRCLQMNTGIKVNQIEALIRINYFQQFGKRKKLLKLYDEFFNGTEYKNKVTKTLKSYEKRMNFLKEKEKEIPDEDLTIGEIINDEHNFLGLCLSHNVNADRRLYYIEEVDDKYGINIKLYSIQRGTRGTMKLRKNMYNKDTVKEGSIISLEKWRQSPKNRWVNGKRIPIEGEYDNWITEYTAA